MELTLTIHSVFVFRRLALSVISTCDSVLLLLLPLSQFGPLWLWSPTWRVGGLSNWLF